MLDRRFSVDKSSLHKSAILVHWPSCATATPSGHRLLTSKYSQCHRAACVGEQEPPVLRTVWIFSTSAQKHAQARSMVVLVTKPRCLRFERWGGYVAHLWHTQFQTSQPEGCSDVQKMPKCCATFPQPLCDRSQTSFLESIAASALRDWVKALNDWKVLFAVCNPGQGFLYGVWHCCWNFLNDQHHRHPALDESYTQMLITSCV